MSDTSWHWDPETNLWWCSNGLLDDDGYPTEDTLAFIRTWHHARGYKDLMAFVKRVWWRPDWGWHEQPRGRDFLRRQVHRYNISTGGWSGNESIIHSLGSNLVFWSMCWVQSRRGGHYIFEIRKPTKEKTNE